MLLDRLLDHFDRVSRLHIDVNDVRDQLIAMGVQDEINFHFVKMDASKIRGLLYRYERHDAPYGLPKFVSEILIPQDMGEEAEAWQRLVAVKEMLHITDSDELCAMSEQAVDNLFDQFSLPPELRNGLDSGGVGKSFLNDRVRIYAALAVLLPAICRDKLRPLYESGRLTSREIAEIAKLPVRYIPVVMEENFSDFIGTIIGWERSEERQE